MEIKKVIGRVKYHINSRFYRFDNVALARSICSIDRYFFIPICPFNILPKIDCFNIISC